MDLITIWQFWEAIRHLDIGCKGLDEWFGEVKAGLAGESLEISANLCFSSKELKIQEAMVETLVETYK